MTYPIVIAIDAMGGEDSPKKIFEGIKISQNTNPGINKFILFGKEKLLSESLKNYPTIIKIVEIVNVEDSVKDDESPLTALKKGKSTSMWHSIEAQKKNIAQITLSAGNTGALLVMSRMILDTLENIEKPALAGLWPNSKGMNIVLDLGANIICNEKHLSDFCIMGAALFNSLYKNEEAKVALLNVGSEETKGNENLKKTYSIMKEKYKKDYTFTGYVEGNEIMDGRVNVIVTDGFTGNIALKTAEGTANFIMNSLKQSFTSTLMGKLSLLFSYNVLKKFKMNLDPRKYNGAILLGLNGPVVKSHGSTDATGFSNSINMCNKIIEGNLISKIKFNISNA